MEEVSVSDCNIQTLHQSKNDRGEENLQAICISIWCCRERRMLKKQHSCLNQKEFYFPLQQWRISMKPDPPASSSLWNQSTRFVDLVKLVLTTERLEKPVSLKEVFRRKVGVTRVLLSEQACQVMKLEFHLSSKFILPYSNLRVEESLFNYSFLWKEIAVINPGWIF